MLFRSVSRTELGKSGAKHIREQGMIPAVVYKGGKAGANVQVDAKELWSAVHTEAGENAIITMNIKGESDNLIEKTVIVQEVQLEPISDQFFHIDFHEISLKEKLKVKVPVVLKGEAVGVTEEKGILAQIEWEIEIECFPTAIPEHINLQVDKLRIGDAIHLKDIADINDVKFLGDPEQVIVTVTPPKAEEEETVEETEEGAEGVEPEVIQKGKKDEEDVPAEGEAKAEG